MATKKKTKKPTGATKSKKPTAKKVMPPKKLAKKLTKKARTPKKLAKKTAVPKKAAAKRKAATKKPTNASKRQTRKNRQRDAAAFSRETAGSRSGEQSGDLQGLRNVEGADSESVGELLGEGNAFEGEVVAGVEDAADHGEREVRTHEVPEDDVPDEYLDKQ
jgi:type IV secretory pathway VirB10-like protein